MLLLRLGGARERNGQSSNGNSKGSSVEPGAHASMLFSLAAYS